VPDYCDSEKLTTVIDKTESGELFEAFQNFGPIKWNSYHRDMPRETRIAAIFQTFIQPVLRDRERLTSIEFIRLSAAEARQAKNLHTINPMGMSMILKSLYDAKLLNHTPSDTTGSPVYSLSMRGDEFVSEHTLYLEKEKLPPGYASAITLGAAGLVGATVLDLPWTYTLLGFGTGGLVGNSLSLTLTASRAQKSYDAQRNG
jgi:hypothetical protein